MTATAQLVLPVVKPRLSAAPLAAGMGASGAGELWQEKADGVWLVGGLALAGHWLNAEAMPDGSFVVNDVIAVSGQDMRAEATAVRWRALQEIARAFPSDVRLCRTGTGGEFLQAILADGGEGIVAKPWDAPFAVAWVKCKRLETFDCTVAEIGPRQSIRLEFEGGNAGWCPCADGHLCRLKMGDVVEIAAQGRHASGKFREARFIRARPDLAYAP